MSEWKIKRFWEQATVAPDGDGFAVLLDGRAVMTPAKSPLVVPGAVLAKEIAAEWNAQESAIDPSTMPFTRSANAAIDKVGPQHAEVARMIAEYGESDLLCYRAVQPDALVARQKDAWTPVVEWARLEQNIDLKVFSGLMPQPQDPAALAEIRRVTQAMDPFELTGFHDLVTISGSFLLGLAVARQAWKPREAWELSRVEESWQEEQWGRDEEAAKAAENRRAAFLDAARFLEMATIRNP